MNLAKARPPSLCRRLQRPARRSIASERSETEIRDFLLCSRSAVALARAPLVLSPSQYLRLFPAALGPMRADLAAGLRAVAEALPAGTPVPVPREILLELLASRAGSVQPSAMPPADLTVADLCARFSRKPSAVRAWLERGDFEGAYKLKGRDWRVPAAAADRFQADQVGGAGAKTQDVEIGDLGAWRQQRGRS
jgi:hypothetical protein